MEVMHKRVAGIDVHKATVVGCVRLHAGRKVAACCHPSRASERKSHCADTPALPRKNYQTARVRRNSDKQRLSATMST